MQNRQKVQKHIDSLHLGKPWKTVEVDDKVTHINAPKIVPNAGAPFHCITYYADSGVLALYATQLFKPLDSPCSRFVSCKTNLNGTKLVFMLLFPKVDPAEAHVSFVIVDLDPTVTVNKNCIQITVDRSDYVRCLRNNACSFGLSRPIYVTGSEYIVANLNGNLKAVSMTTGNMVMADSQPGWEGCHLNLKKGQISPSSNLQVASTCKGLQILLYAQRQNSAILLQLNDGNSREKRLKTFRAFQKWTHSIDRDGEMKVSMLQSVRRLCWTFDGHLDVHVECFMESLVRELTDIAIQSVDGAFTEDQRQTFHTENMEIPFLRRISQPAEDKEEGRVSDYNSELVS